MDIKNVVNEEANRISNDAAPIKDIIHENMDGFMNDPIGVVIPFLQTHMWILTLIAICFAISGFYNVYRMRKQKQDEMDIKNMFNADGTKNEHYAHKDYNPMRSFIFMVLTLLFEVLLNISIM